MGQRMTARAQAVVTAGQQEAVQMNAGYVGTEHLLLALTRETEGAIVRIFQELKIAPEQIRRAILTHTPPNPAPSISEPMLTPKAKRVLEFCAEEAEQTNGDEIGPEHIFLALLREKDGLAAIVLRKWGVTLKVAREHVLGQPEPNYDNN